MSEEIRTFRVDIKGITPMLHHNPASMGNEELQGLIRVLQKNPNDKEAYTKEAEHYLYRNRDNILCIPTKQIKRSMELAGKKFKVRGQGNTRYDHYVHAFVLLSPNLAQLEPQEYQLHREFVIVNRARIIRTRPMFPSGWTTSFNMTVLEKSIPEDTLEEILEYAGNFNGIGDYRGEFGRFEVTKFESVDTSNSKKSRKS